MTRSFRDDNAAYEAWLRKQCDVVEDDLRYKHERMKKNPFVFLRATYFRWAGRIERLCPDLRDAPAVLSAADTHVENFGTWRDAEGRLVWGVNDFDEAATIAYPFDLVRLAASVRLSPNIAVSNADSAAAILVGYHEGLRDPHPMLLDEEASWIRGYVGCSDKDRQKFWKEVRDYPKAENPPPQIAGDLLGSAPEGAAVKRIATRAVGGGSLGRPRYVLLAAWRGGKVVREAKALVPSAWYWAHGVKAEPSHFLELANGKHRSPDPFLTVRNGFILRRIAADSRKIDLHDVAGAGLTAELLRAMGRDLGSIHAAGAGAADRIRRDLDPRPDDWLHAAAKAAAAAVEQDHKEWVH